MCDRRLVRALTLIVVASAVRGDHRNAKSTISLHQSPTGSDESFTPPSAYGGGGGRFPADIAAAAEPVFAPALPLPEKHVLELGGGGSAFIGADIERTTSASGRGGPSGRSQAQADVEHHPAAQKIYPTFFRNIPPLGHSRPYYQSTEAAVEQRFNKLRAGLAAAPPLPEVTSPLLGSGDFGVIKGGTFYYDTDAPGKGFVDDFYGLGYNNNNGHGRPQLAFLVQKPHQKEEQFSNFRDFADINISNDPAYSHHAPRYVGVPGGGPLPPELTRAGFQPTPAAPAVPDGPTADVRPEPENILDELRSLDAESPKAASTGKASARGKVKKSTLVDRKKRPKEASRQREAKEQPDGEDYMLASS